VLDAAADEAPAPAAPQEAPESAERTEASRFQAIHATAAAAAEAIVTVDDQGRIELVNPAAESMFGYDRGEMTGRGVDEFLPASRRGESDGPRAPRLASAMARSLGLGRESVGLRKDGTTFPIEVTISQADDGAGPSYTAIVRDITRRKRDEEEMRHLASHDVLTGLANRALFHDRLGEALAAGERSGRMAAVMLLDLDDFKRINDTLGHPLGDRLLCEVAERLRHCSRKSDTVARLGGDEFAIVATNLESADAATFLASRIIDSLAAPVRLDGHRIETGTSVGVSLFPTDATDAESLLINAERALYQAKAAGRGTYRFFSERINAQVQARRQVERELRRALEREELIIHYQPVHDLEGDDVVGVEALLRWQHPERGLILPGEFMDVAEATGLIVPIGEWVLRTVCTHVRSWQDAGAPPVRVSVNLSAAQLDDPGFVDTVRGILASTGCDGTWLELEITESVITANAEAIAVAVRAFRELGIRAAIDDFGTGHSSLAELAQVPVDRLKIDRSYVRALDRSPEDAAAAAAIIDLARSLDIGVVAEGVETAAQLAFLRDQGCVEGQGFLMSRPLAGSELERFLDARLEGRAPGPGPETQKHPGFRPRLVPSGKSS
jgi:diguanylate cyclase (GGDEF)-like protein/PAS domain S-box-containing protein